MKVVFSSIRIDTPASSDVLLRADLGGRLTELLGTRRAVARRPLDLLDGPSSGLVQRDAPVCVLDAVALEDLESLLLPGAGDAEDRDLLGGIMAELDARLDHAPGDDVHAGVGDD